MDLYPHVYSVRDFLPSKGSGPSSIPLTMLKEAADIIVGPLCYIINVSFSTGVFPDALKIAKVLPLRKGGSTQDLNNFRLISLLSIFDKIILFDIAYLLHVRNCSLFSTKLLCIYL